MTNMRCVKVWVCVACLATSLAAPLQPTSLTLDIIDVAAISRMSPQQLEKLAEGLAAEEIMRTKRSSAQALTSVVSKASSGLQSKVGFLGQASAFISSASSKHGGDEHAGYSYEPHDDKVDFWGLKKSILYTLFQAVKAITGGVTILKGQLIKGGGHLATTLGKVIAVKGDAVSNLGKKIVSSAALSHKKPHSTAVYGPPPPTHVEYAPSAYGAPTAPAHFSHTAPSAPTGYAAHKYPAHLDGRGKLNGVHAGVVILTPLGDTAPSESHPPSHTPLEPPPSILNSVYSAIKTAFTPAVTQEQTYNTYQPPPPPEPYPSFKPMGWGAVNSYGEPASADAFTDYDPKNPYPPYATAKLFSALAPAAPPAPTSWVKKATRISPDKIQKIKHNLAKVNALFSNDPLTQRSSEVMSKFNALDVIRNGFLAPTSVVSDNEIGVLPADLLPEASSTISTTTSQKPTATNQKLTATNQESTATNQKSTATNQKSTSTDQKVTSPDQKVTSTEKTERKDVKYYLRGNRIVIHS